MIPFSPPHIDEKVIKEVIDTLQSGWITTGPKTKLFEKKISAYCGAKSTLCLNSATAGLELMLRWYGVGEGDEVILPAYTYSATANVVIHCGAKPVFVDVDENFSISISEIKKHITPHTKVIMPVDFAGVPCDYDSLNELVNQTDIKKLFQSKNETQKKLGRILILSDAAHSFGAIYKGKKTGCLTDVTVFSFHAVKNLTTAEGGAVCLNLPEPFNCDEEYAYLCVKSLHGQNKDALAKTKPGNWKYDIVEAGYKYNMTDIAASIGLIELERYDEDTLKKRDAIFEKYNSAFKEKSWAQTPVYKTNDYCGSFHLYPLRIKNISEEKRDLIISKIFEKGISVNVHFIPVPMMSFYKKLGYDISDYPTTYDNYSREISLPVYYTLSNENVQKVIDAVIQSVEECI